MADTFDEFCLRFTTTDQEREELRTMLAAIRMRQFLNSVEPMAMILVRTIVSEAERTGSWTVSSDLQERMQVLVKERSQDRR